MLRYISRNNRLLIKLEYLAARPSKPACRQNAGEELLNQLLSYVEIRFYILDYLLKVWDACSEASISFDDHIKFRNKNGICSITENDLLVAAAMKSLQDTNVHTKFNTKIVDCSIPENNDLQKLTQLKLSDESTISARLVVSNILYNFIY